MLPPERFEVQAFQVDDHPAFCRLLTRYFHPVPDLPQNMITILGA